MTTGGAAVADAQTVTEMLSRCVERWPHRVAALEPRDTGDRRLTFIELSRQVADLRNRLRDHGLRRGDVAVAWLPNGLEYLVLLLACAAAGVTVVGANTRYREHELAHILRQARPRLIVRTERLLGIDFQGVLAGATRTAAEDPDWVRPGVCVVAEEGGRSMKEAEASPLTRWGLAPGLPNPQPIDSDAHADDLWLTFTTSGSTGMPKLAAHDQRSVVHHTQESAEVVDLRTGDVFLGVLPLSGVFGLIPVLGALWSGATTLLYPVFEAGRVVRDMSRHGVTHVVGGDDLFGALHDAWLERPVDLTRLRRVAVADFEGRVVRLAEWVEALTEAKVCGVYGSSEVFSLLAVRSAEGPAPIRLRGGGGLVGAQTQARTVDLVSREPMPPGEEGELQVRGPQVLQAYLTSNGVVPPSLAANGWFDTGDLGSVSPDGRVIEYHGRAGDALRLRGFLVQPAEIEAVVSQHDAVALVKVVAAQVEERAAAVAFVTPKRHTDIDPEQIRRFCAERIAAFKVPARVVVVDSMPTTSGTNGSKIKAAELRRRAQELFT